MHATYICVRDPICLSIEVFLAITGLSSLPSLPLQPGLFQPAQHSVQVAEEQQTDMEQAFMKLFVQIHGD